MLLPLMSQTRALAFNDDAGVDGLENLVLDQVMPDMRPGRPRRWRGGRSSGRRKRVHRGWPRAMTGFAPSCPSSGSVQPQPRGVDAITSGAGRDLW
jgi:hypothetical protein